MNSKQKFKGGLAYSTDSSLKITGKDADATTLAPGLQTLKVKLDNKKRAGKTVTLVDNFIGSSEDLETLGKLLKTKCGTGGSAKDGEIIIQGDVVTKVKEILIKEGYKVK
jgi:translation initiation factor 1